MKYGRQILQNSVPEWQPFYIDYNQLKNMLKEIKSLIANMQEDDEELGGTPLDDIQLVSSNDDGGLSLSLSPPFRLSNTTAN